MGKLSSKKKRLKNSSQSRTRKKNKVKSRRNKSKKLRRLRDGSVSYTGDSDSRSSSSFSSSSFEDDYRRPRSWARSRNKKDIKHGKKRAKGQSSTGEISEYSPRVKKCRGSGRDDGYKKRSRIGKKKRSRRDVSVSSWSSGSQSYSTGRSVGSSDCDDIRVKKRGRREKKKDARRPEKVKRKSERTWDRSRSCSSCSRYDEDSDYPVEERLTEESYPRRLKSVITVVQYENENESSRKLNSDDAKEVYDYDDYPSCRSNDSNDGGNLRDLPQHSHAISKRKGILDDEQGEFCDIKTSNLEEGGKDCKPSYDLRESNKVPSDAGGVNGDDMESRLRQRALENLKKFRGGFQKTIKPPITQNDRTESVGNTPSSVNMIPSCIKTPKGDDAGVLISSQVRQQIKQPLVGRDSTSLPKNDKKSHLNDGGKDTGTVESGLASPPSQVAPATIPRVEVSSANSSVSYKSKLVTLRARQEPFNTHTTQKQETRQEPSNTYTTQKQEPTSQEPSQARLVSMSSVNDSGLETAQTGKLSEHNACIISVSNRPKSVNSRIRQESPISTQKTESIAVEPFEANKLVPDSTVNKGDLGTAKTVKPLEHSAKGDKVENYHVPACDNPPATSTSGHISSDKPEDETKDGSQLQQKTMSVKRGGEMVQVSYQVYIPKRAPALARRQFKR